MGMGSTGFPHVVHLCGKTHLMAAFEGSTAMLAEQEESGWN